MPAFPPILILRHGQTEWNVQGRLQGHLDSALTAEGTAQARTQKAILMGQNLTGFQAISSPQGRARETARLALEGLLAPIRTDPALGEIGIGDWAGRTRTEVMAQSGARDGFDVYELAPGGEGFAALHSRCTGFLRQLQGPSVLVTHGITSRMLRLILTNRPISDLRAIEGGQGVVFRLAEGQQTRLTLGG